MDKLVVIPTYNEKQNIGLLLNSLISMHIPGLSILVIDDSSPDGTSLEVAKMMKNFSNIHMIVRDKRMGLGTAYVAGIKWAFSRGYKVLVQMDGDLSHDPLHLPKVLDEAKRYDFVIGSRYIHGGSVENWPLTRRIISRLGNAYAQFLLGDHVSDFTGGYNAWNIAVLKAIEVEKIMSEGYCFQIEIKYKAIINNFSFTEVPIVFRDRIGGKSKLSKRVVLEAAVHVPRLKIWPS